MSALDQEGLRETVLEALAQPLGGLGIGVDGIEGDFRLFGSGALDSLGLVEVLVSIQEKLGRPLEFDELDFNQLDTIDDLVLQLTALTNGVKDQCSFNA
jgi:acyl carrier protein